EGVDEHVLLGELGLLGEAVDGRPAEEEEERIEPAERPGLVFAVELGSLEPLLPEIVHTLPRLGGQLVPVAELDGAGRAGLGARRAGAVVVAVVVERALGGGEGVPVDGDHVEPAGHRSTTPFRTLHRRAFYSWMYAVGSPRLATRSLVMSPLAESMTPWKPQCQWIPTL